MWEYEHYNFKVILLCGKSVTKSNDFMRVFINIGGTNKISFFFLNLKRPLFQTLLRAH